MAGGEEPPAQVRRRIRLEPTDIIQNMKSKHLKGESAGIGRVVGPADPDGSMLFQDPAAGLDPGKVELEIFLYPGAHVPGSLVYRSPPSATAGESSVGQVIRGVGEDEIYRFVGQLAENFDAVTAIEGEFLAGEVRDRGVHRTPGTLTTEWLDTGPGRHRFFSDLGGGVLSITTLSADINSSLEAER